MNPIGELGRIHVIPCTENTKRWDPALRQTQNVLVGRQTSPTALEWVAPSRAFYIALNDEVIRP
jgi:hypothetical protein